MGKRGPKKTGLDNREASRIRILAYHRAGRTPAWIAKTERCTRQTVYNTVAREATGKPLTDLPRSGRPRMITRKLLSTVRLLAKDRKVGSVRRITAELHKRGINVCFKTVASSLHHKHLRAVHPRRKPLISPVNQRNRVQWCIARMDDTTEKAWRRVVFSDEKSFVMNPQRRTVWIDEWEPIPIKPMSMR
jgi:transposase